MLNCEKFSFQTNKQTDRAQGQVLSCASQLKISFNLYLQCFQTVLCYWKGEKTFKKASEVCIGKLASNFRMMCGIIVRTGHGPVCNVFLGVFTIPHSGVWRASFSLISEVGSGDYEDQSNSVYIYHKKIQVRQ